MVTSFSWNTADQAREAALPSDPSLNVCSQYPKCDWMPEACKNDNHSYFCKYGSVNGPLEGYDSGAEIEQPSKSTPPPLAPMLLKRKNPPAMKSSSPVMMNPSPSS